jgi:hypothetical protein
VNVQSGQVYLADIFEGGTRPVVIVTRPELSRGTIVLVGTYVCLQDTMWVLRCIIGPICNDAEQASARNRI